MALGVSERTFRRWRGRHAEDGCAGLVDRRVGKPSPRRAPEDELQRMLRLYHEHYAGFAIRHFHDTLRRRHGYKLGYTTTRLWLQKSGAVAAAPKRGAHRRKRPRRPMVGMMLHQDGSTHAWLVGQPALDLVITLDDATSAIYSAVLVDQEGTASSFRGLAEVIERHGLFIELYTDRGSHYFHTPEAGGKVSKTQLTQVGRALEAARHRPHRRLLAAGQGPLRAGVPHPPGPAAEGAAAGRDHHRRGRQPVPARGLSAPSTTPASPSRPSSRPRPSSRCRAELWRDLLCVQEERQVGNDNCVRWQGRVLQIPPSPLRPHFVRSTVRLHAYPDGTVADLQGPAPSGHLPAGGRAAGPGHGRVTTATRPGRWICGQRSALPTTPPAHNSGQLMRSLWRTS